MKKLTILIMTAILLFTSTQYTWATEADFEETAVSEKDAFVIVLDPGHDSTHGGANGNGLSETALNLKIAQYCYEELRTYSNVKVYMTRYTSECPYPETCGVSLGSRKDNKKRVEFAASVDADVYVALHLNSYTNASVHGAEVYVPNTNYLPEVGKEGTALGKTILNHLAALGLKNKGTFTRLSEDGTHYEDGSLADYYGVIKRAKDFGIPGIIVEHAYISNASDAANYLTTEAQLKALGVADATGIAEYYGLVKGGEILQPDTLYTVKFMHNGKLISTQYVRDGYHAIELDEEEIDGINITYDRSLSLITSDTVIQVTYDPAPEPEPEPEPPTESESESESEIETELETETGSEAETEPETETGTEAETESETETETEGETSAQELTEESEADAETTSTEVLEDDATIKENSSNWGVVMGVILGIFVCTATVTIVLWKKKSHKGE